MANFTTTTSAVFIPEVWSNKVTIATEAKLVAANLVSRYDADVSGEGDIIHVPNVSNFNAARTKSADTELTFDTITETETTITVNNHVYKAFVVEDILAKQSAYDVVSYYTEKAGYSIAKKVDSDLLGLYTGFTTNDVGSYEADITAASVIAAQAELAANDVPIEDINCIVHPRQSAAMMNIQQFVTVDYQGEFQKPTVAKNGPASNHLHGSLYGIDFYRSSNVATTSGTTTSVHNVMFHKEAWGLAMQMAPRVQKQYRLSKLADEISVDTIYGYNTIRADFGVEIRTRLT